MIRKILFVFCFGFVISINAVGQNHVDDNESFSFAFLTDIHLKPEMGAPVGFQMAIDKVMLIMVGRQNV
jgi:hypothetical protein